jgi:eukaryotic-like serine/threonine-protein kinase
MRYCINPNCKSRINLCDAILCQGKIIETPLLLCETPLLLGNGRFEVLSQISKARPKHPYEVFRVRDTRSGEHHILKTLIIEGDFNNLSPLLKTAIKLFDREKDILKDSADYYGIPNYVMDVEIPLTSSLKLDYLVMKSIDGQDLDEWLKVNKRLKDKETTISWLKEITEHLDYLHHLGSKGHLHRDIKPSNIIRKKNGELVLVDFGSTAEITAGGALTEVCTLYYAAPEQLKNGSEAYTESDFFALGKTFVHLLTGVAPKSGPISLDEWQYRTGLREQGIIPLIGWLLQENRSQRPQKAGDILKVIHYIDDRKQDGSFPNDEDTIKFILGIQQPSTIKHLGHLPSIAENSNTATTVLSSASPETPVDSNPVPKANKKRTTLLTGISISILVGIVGLLAYHLFNTGKNTPPTPSPNRSQSPSVPTHEVLISFGDRDIYNYSANIEIQNLKNAAIVLFNSEASNHYRDAYDKFYAAWQLEQNQKNITRKPTDPMLLIYMNNAKVRYWHGKKLAENNIDTKINTIVLAAPIQDNRGKKMLYGVAHAQNRVVQKDSILTNNSINEEPPVYLEVGIVDDDNNPNQAIEVAKKLKNLNITGADGIPRQILTVIGHYTSEATCVALPYYANVGLPIISPTSSMYKLGKKGTKCNPNNKPGFFRTNSSSEVEAKTLIDLLKERKIQNLKVTAFYKKDTPGEREGFSQDLFESFQRQYKEEFTTELKGFDLSTRDKNQDTLTLGIEDMQNSNVVVLFPNGNTNDGSNAFKNAESVIEAAKKIKEDKPDQIKLILASNPLLSQDIDVAQFAGWNGKFGIAVDWHKECKNQISTSFLTEQKNLWGDNDVDRITAQSYEAGQVIFTILSKPEISRGSSFLSKLEATKQFDITSEVFKGKKIGFKMEIETILKIGS